MSDCEQTEGLCTLHEASGVPPCLSPRTGTILDRLTFAMCQDVFKKCLLVRR